MSQHLLDEIEAVCGISFPQGVELVPGWADICRGVAAWALSARRVRALRHSGRGRSPQGVDLILEACAQLKAEERVVHSGCLRRRFTRRDLPRCAEKARALQVVIASGCWAFRSQGRTGAALSELRRVPLSILGTRAIRVRAHRSGRLRRTADHDASRRSIGEASGRRSLPQRSSAPPASSQTPCAVSSRAKYWRGSGEPASAWLRRIYRSAGAWTGSRASCEPGRTAAARRCKRPDAAVARVPQTQPVHEPAIRLSGEERLHGRS